MLAIVNPLAATTVIGYEEPENGVHPRRLKLIADLFKNAAESGETQVLVNTHSPILPSYFEDEALVVCRKEGRSSIFVPFSSPLGKLFWEREIAHALDEQPLAFTERMIRGDFDG